MLDSERLLKELDLDYKSIVKDVAWVIKPKDFLCKSKILLISKNKFEHEMMLLDENDNIIESDEFTEVANITDVYSYLYNYYNKNLKNKTRNEITIGN